MSRFPSFLIAVCAVLLLILSTVTGPGCANIVPPSGGPRDSTAPQLIRASPVDSSRNFKERRITLVFDDYLTMENAQQELLVSPVPKIMPVVDYHLNTITVRLRDSLDPNTTYTIDFGNSIRDVNESNIVRNFTYTFTTGQYFDSLTLGGKVLIAETGKIDSTLIVMLHTSGIDSAVVKEKPRYVARVDSAGNFLFKNLPPKTYYVYALKDENGTRRYSSDAQLFAFADSAVSIAPGVKPVTLYAFSVPQAPRTSTSVARPPRNTNAGADRRLKFTTSATSTQQDLLSDLQMTFEQPLKNFDTTKVGLFTDSIFTPVPAWSFGLDSTRHIARLSTAWKENTQYHLVLDVNFAEDSLGKKLLRTDTISFRTKKLIEYGEIALKFRNLDMSKNPVLLFIVNDALSQSYKLTGPEFTKQVFLPGEYSLRILYDDNKNGKWDPGSFFGARRQPEMVKPIDRRILVKGNWKNEFEIAL